jgi:hypothetical protein
MVVYERVGSQFSRSGTRPISGSSCHGSLRLVWSNLRTGLMLNLGKGHASHGSVLFSPATDPKRWISHYPLAFICIISKSEVTWPVTGSWLKLIHAQNIRMSSFRSSSNFKLREMHTSSSLRQSFIPLIRFSLQLLLGICHTICLTYLTLLI